ncbi:phenylalanine--tRNA ligase subunit alpha [Alienimonas chondri]|uniref:Phenylalanine--tRNA ligase alpha subunit n=1 Tax=Alienimonas chondri TaxID=2681879 RepID=A0ABX1VAR5_9PLAN|nr:phenylalanine--tRNA ligase subunit alpha [Alienimonas chondri]NNJ25035.1 Phenylalanine--tRNA ligase alpha subunit [Alienimonas chondri]
MSDPTAAFADYEREATAALAAAATPDDLEAARIEFLGKKQGRLRDLQKSLGSVPKEDKPAVGKAFNEVKTRVQAALDARQAELESARAGAAVDALDVTLPGRAPHRIGAVHPLTRTIAEFKGILGRLGFTAVDGPEVEDERHNFNALNIPDDHPARDPLENFYLSAASVGKGEGPLLLRSQTSTVQIRVMEQTPPPVRVISIGRVYRPDTIDATHHCQFHQMEGLMVGEGVTMAHLKTVLTLFCRAYLGEGTKVRFRPSFFPFTEPSVEADALWHGAGTGDGGAEGRWLELGGAGMVDPNVLEAVGYDPEKVSGFAFGFGMERFCMMRHGISDIRLLTENDVRFLRQFG